LNKKQMKTVFHPSSSRGGADYGWLRAKHSFSFGSWFDPSRVQFGALRVLNDDWVAPGTGFSKHPHSDMEIITIPFEGKLRHQDSLGSVGEILPGEVQVMSAGTGIEHSEVNPDRQQALRLFQIWILPDRRGHEPRYDQRAFALPSPGEWVEYVGPMGQTEGIEIHQDAHIRRLSLAPDHSVRYALKSPNHGVYLISISGEALIEQQTLNTRDALGLWDTDALEIKALSGLDLLAIEVPM
jgi:redox-sensitive bicupin YhaK (pirin superfamily)